jgi:hypothetical protein
MECDQLDVAHDGASLENNELAKLHGQEAIKMRKPTSVELWNALGRKTVPSTEEQGCTITGELHVQKVGGILSITVSKKAWAEVTAFFLFGNFINGKERHYNVR